MKSTLLIACLLLSGCQSYYESLVGDLDQCERETGQPCELIAMPMEAYEPTMRIYNVFKQQKK